MIPLLQGVLVTSNIYACSPWGFFQIDAPIKYFPFYILLTPTPSIKPPLVYNTRIERKLNDFQLHTLSNPINCQNVNNPDCARTTRVENEFFVRRDGRANEFSNRLLHRFCHSPGCSDLLLRSWERTWAPRSRSPCRSNSCQPLLMVMQHGHMTRVLDGPLCWTFP